MNPEKTYGGKAGVWLTKKCRISASKLKTPLMLSSSSSKTTNGKKSNPLKLSEEQKLFSRDAIIIKKPRAEVFLLKASRHIGCIPKKFLFEQRKRPLNYSSTCYTSNSSKRQKQKVQHGNISQDEFLNEHRYTVINEDDVGYHNADRTYQFSSSRITQSPNVRILGWDSMKCRPIYNSTLLQNNDVGSNFTLRGTSDNTNSTSNGYVDNFLSFENEFYDNESKTNDEEDGYSDDENQDPNVMWRDILSKLNEKSRTANMVVKSRQTYGGGLKAKRSNNGTTAASIYTRRGLSKMPQSVLERIVSPKQNRKQLSNLCKKQNFMIISTSKRKNEIRRKINVSPKNRRASTENQCNQNALVRASSPKQASRRSLKYISEEDYTSVLGASPSSNSNSKAFHSRKIPMTPMTKNIIGDNVCLAPNSDLSKDDSISSVLYVPTSQQLARKKSILDINNLSSPPSTLQFPDSLDYNEKENSLSYPPKTGTKKKREVGNKQKDMSSRRQKHAKALNKKASKAKAQGDENCNGNPVNQITSSTSLAAAKAFFERLDRYELTIA